jgi:hypothetical protein
VIIPKTIMLRTTNPCTLIKYLIKDTKHNTDDTAHTDQEMCVVAR